MTREKHEEIAYKSRVAKYKFISFIIFIVLVFLGFIFRDMLNSNNVEMAKIVSETIIKIVNSYVLGASIVLNFVFIIIITIDVKNIFRSGKMLNH